MALLRTASLLASLAVVVAVVVDCKRDAPPAPGSASASASADHVHSHEPLPPVGSTVRVTFEGKSVDVALSSIPPDGAPGFISVAKLWAAARPGEDSAALTFDFVGSDGFRSTQKAKCAKLLHGRDLTTARLETATHDLVFEEGSTLPGCYRVKAVVAVEVKRDP